jgi:hypothetical protein
MTVAESHTQSLTEKRLARMAPANDSASVIETLLIKGDLGKLDAAQRNAYYLKLCEVTGLNPLTQPFEYLTLQGKTVLYAKKACTDQLRALHRISVVDMDQDEREGLYTVTVKVQNHEGRTDMDVGSVNVQGLKGDARANAIMKASTKAKRRATLSICGLGLLDETEVETIPGAVVAEPQPNKVLNPETGRMVDPNSANQLRKNGAWDSFLDKLQSFEDAHDLDGLKRWFTSDDVSAKIAAWPQAWRENAEAEFARVHDALAAEVAAQ